MNVGVTVKRVVPSVFYPLCEANAGGDTTPTSFNVHAKAWNSPTPRISGHIRSMLLHITQYLQLYFAQKLLSASTT